MATIFTVHIHQPCIQTSRWNLVCTWVPSLNLIRRFRDRHFKDRYDNSLWVVLFG